MNIADLARGYIQGGMPAGGNNPLQMIGQIKQFAASMRGKNPQQEVMNLMRQRGIRNDQLQSAMQQAKQIQQMLGLK